MMDSTAASVHSVAQQQQQRCRWTTNSTTKRIIDRTIPMMKYGSFHQKRKSSNSSSNSMMMMILLFLSNLFLLSNLYMIQQPFFSSTVIFVQGYPLLIEMEEDAERCVRFNVPEGDDAHLVVLTLPNTSEMDNNSNEVLDVESYYIEQVYQLTQQRSKQQILPRELPNELPSNISKLRSDYLQKNHGDTSQLHIKISGTPNSNPHLFQHHYVTKYFIPTILNHIGRTTDARTNKYKQQHEQPEHNLEGYGLCFVNKNTEQTIQIIFDVILHNDDRDHYNVDESSITTGGTTGSGGTGGFDRERHLTPLEKSLEQSIHAANTVVREMNYLERREQRMRKTAESINVRVRWFSYLSISVLLTVTYIQVTYLKTYFHKKKLL